MNHVYYLGVLQIFTLFLTHTYTVKNNGTLLSFKMWNTLKNVKYH